MTPHILENRFEVESQLRCTDFSRVYSGCDRRFTHRPACLITAIPYHQREIRHRLEREAQRLEQLGRHPQIPRVLAYFYDSEHGYELGQAFEHKPGEQANQSDSLGIFYLVQDYIVGHPLSDEIVPPKKLSESYVNKLIKDVLVALTFAHEQGLVHQNLHPQHLIRESREGQIFVTQFGMLAKIARSKVTTDGRLGSSIPVSPSPYSAPEQLRATADESEQPQPASDLYALGLIAIEALTGQRHHNFPFDPQCGLRWRDQAAVSLPMAEFIDRLIRQDWRDRFINAKDALETFKSQSARSQIANDSRLPTVIAAPGHKIATTAITQIGSKTGIPQKTGQLRVPASNLFFSKLAIGSVALLLALGAGVKTYQWGEYRISTLPEALSEKSDKALDKTSDKTLDKVLPQWWQKWRSPNRTYPAADPTALTPLLADGSLLLQPAAATAFWQMVDAASAEGIELYPLSGYSLQNDTSLNNDYATGYAIDIGGPEADLDRQRPFAKTATFKWLKRNAKKHGFELSLAQDRRLGGTLDEPWHWRYIGDTASQQVFGR